jgi:hypothetical protein
MIRDSARLLRQSAEALAAQQIVAERHHQSWNTWASSVLERAVALELKRFERRIARRKRKAGSGT